MAPFASISASIASVANNLGRTSASGASARTETHTGIDFPLEFCYNKKTHCPCLVGLGVRSKNILVKNIHVYALGVYVDANAAKYALSSFKSMPASQLVDEQAFYDAVVTSDAFEKSLRLVISSKLVDRKKFVDALEERLKPKLAQAGEPGLLDAFRKQFDDVTFRKDLEVSFVATGEGRLVTQVDGVKKGVLSSPVLVRSLFDIYLGADPVSKDTKRTFGESMAAILGSKRRKGWQV